MPTAADKMWAAYGGQWVPIPTGNTSSSWTRPAYWPTTTVTVEEQKIQMVAMVWNYSNNPLTIVASGAFTVDWGDNTGTQNFATGATAVHNYSWSASGLTGTTVEGYRCALVTITPQASNQLTSLGLTTSNSGTLNYNAPVLEVVVGPSTLTSLTVGSTVRLTACTALRHVNFLSPVTLNGLNLFRYCGSLRKVTGSNITFTSSCAGMFSGCPALSDLPTAFTLDATVTSCLNMFGFCQVLTSIPKMDTSRVTSFASMFEGCYWLSEAPPLNTSAGTDFGWMFSECKNLTSVPLYDTANGTIFTAMFRYCERLVVAPALNTAKATDLSYLFRSDFNLKYVPMYNTSLCTNFAYMFYSCELLESLPLLDTANGTNFSYYAAFCHSITSFPALNTAKGTNFSNMLVNCVSLTQVPALNTALATNISYMFGQCYSLMYVPPISAASGSSSVNVTDAFRYCESLKNNPYSSGPKYTFDMSGTMLDVTELNALFTSLPSVSAQTINITNCPGAAGCNRAIATGKGWTVTG